MSSSSSESVSVRLAVVAERSLQGGRSALALVGERDRLQLAQVVEPLHLGLVERSLQCAAGQ